MKFQKADKEDFTRIQHFYWDVIEDIHKNNVNNENLGWEKGVYPSDAFLYDSIENEELYLLTEGDALCAWRVQSSRAPLYALWISFCRSERYVL